MRPFAGSDDMATSGMPEFLQQCIRAPQNTPWWPKPNNISQGFLLRVLLTRLLLTALAIVSLDQAFSDVVVNASQGVSTVVNGTAREWRRRLGLLGLMAPLLVHAAGLLWPFLHIVAYERHHQRYHKVTVATTVLGHLLTVFSKISKYQGCCQQNMLLHGVLFLVHQDDLQQHIQQSAITTAAYSICHAAAQGTWSWVAGYPAASPAALGASTGGILIETPARSSLTLPWTASGEYAVHVFLLLLLLHRLYQAVVGPKEVQGSAEKQALGAQRASRRKSADSSAHCSTKGQQEQQDAIQSKEAQSDAAIGAATLGASVTAGSQLKRSNAAASQQLQPVPAAAACPPATQLNRAYILKLLLVKLAAAAQVASQTAYCLHQLLHDSHDSHPVGTLASPAVFSCIAGLLCTTALAGQVLVASFAGRYYLRHFRVIGTICFYVCVASRLMLLWLHDSVGYQNCHLQGCASVTTASVAHAQHVFRSYLLLACSLVANEDGLGAFAMHLSVLTLAWRSVHIVMASRAPPSSSWVALATKEHLLEFPEYFFVGCMLLLAYNWLCVGMTEQKGHTRQDITASTAAGKVSKKAVSLTSTRRSSSLEQKRSYRLSSNSAKGSGLVAEATVGCQTAAAAGAGAVGTGSTARSSKEQQRPQQQASSAGDQQVKSSVEAAKVLDHGMPAADSARRGSSNPQQQQHAVSSASAADAATYLPQTGDAAAGDPSTGRKLEETSPSTATVHVPETDMQSASDVDAVFGGSLGDEGFIWQQPQQQHTPKSMLIASSHTLPEWTKEGLAKLKKSTFDIPAKEVCGYKSDAEREEAAAAAAAATAAAYCMAKPAVHSMLHRRSLSMLNLASMDHLASSLVEKAGSANSNKRRSSACVSESFALHGDSSSSLLSDHLSQYLGSTKLNTQQRVSLRSSCAGLSGQGSELQSPGFSRRSRRGSRSEATQQQQQQQQQRDASGGLPTVGSFSLLPTGRFRRPSAGVTSASTTSPQQQSSGGLLQVPSKRSSRRLSAGDCVVSEQLVLAPVRYKVRRASAYELSTQQAPWQRQQGQLGAVRVRRGSVNELQMWRLQQQQQQQQYHSGPASARGRRRFSASELLQQRSTIYEGTAPLCEQLLYPSGRRSRRSSMLVCTPTAATNSRSLVCDAVNEPDVDIGNCCEPDEAVDAADVTEAIQFTPVWLDRGQLGSVLPAGTESQLYPKLTHSEQQHQQQKHSQEVGDLGVQHESICTADVAVPRDQHQQAASSFTQQPASSKEHWNAQRQQMQPKQQAAGSSCQVDSNVHCEGLLESLGDSHEQLESEGDMYMTGDTYATADSESEDVQEMTLAEVYAAAAAAAGIVLPSNSLGTTVAECADEESLQVGGLSQQQQWRICDVVVCLQRLPMDIMWTCQIAAKSFLGPSTSGDAAGYGLLLLSSAVAAAYCCGCLGHLYLLMRNPVLADSSRKKLWPAKLGIGTPLVHWALVASGVPRAGPVLQLLVGQAATWAFLDLPRSKIVRWVPYAILSFYLIHLWTCWTRSTLQQLALDACAFAVCPLLTFIIFNELCPWIKSGWTDALPGCKSGQELGQEQKGRSWWSTNSLLFNSYVSWIGSPVQTCASKTPLTVNAGSKWISRILAIRSSVGPTMSRLQYLSLWGFTVGHVLLAMTLAGMLAALPLYCQLPALHSSSVCTDSNDCTCGNGASTGRSCCSSGSALQGLVWFTSGAMGTAMGQAIMQHAGHAAAWQWQVLEQMSHRMDLPLSPATHKTLSGVLLVLAIILTTTAAKALLMRSKWLGRSRQIWYEAAKKAVLTIGERTLSSAVTRRTDSLEGDPEIEALLDTLWDVARPLVSGCSMVLTLLDESSSSCGTATQHIMLTSVATDSASENSGDSGSASSEDSRFLPPVQLPLSALPSVQAVCEGHRLMFTSKFHDQTEESTLNFSDWRDLAKTYGTDCFLAVPLSFAQLDMGTLLLMSDKPAALDKHVRKLVIELGLVVAQTLYTLLCMQQMRAGDCIINDILPEKVADHLRRRLMSTRAVANVGSLNYGVTTSNLFQPVHMRLGTAASLRSPTSPPFPQHQQQQQHLTQGLGGVDWEALKANRTCGSQGEQHQQHNNLQDKEPVVTAGRQQQQQQHPLCSESAPAVAKCLTTAQTAAAAQADSKLTPSIAVAQQTVQTNATAAGGSLLPAHAAAPLGDESLVDQVPPLPNSMRYSCADDWAGSLENGPLHPLSSAGFVARRVFARAISSSTAGLPGVAAPNSMRLSVSNSRKSFSGVRPDSYAIADGGITGLSMPADGAVSEQVLGSSRRNRRASVDEVALSRAAAAAVVYKQWHPNVTVLFADIVGYTALSQEVEPEQVMLLLHQLFSRYDNLCRTHDVYKVETIGDCWMGATGLLADDPAHASRMMAFAKDILAAAASVNSPLGGSVRVRVGVHSGRVMSGIVGSIRARYCLFGDTVNTASRMESTGLPGCVQISEETYSLLPLEVQAEFEPRDAVLVKGKGTMRTYVAHPSPPMELPLNAVAVA